MPVYDATKTLSTRVAARPGGRAPATRSTPSPSRSRAWLRTARRLPLRRDALGALHAPRRRGASRRRERRLAYEELLLLQLALQRRRARPRRGRTGAMPLGRPASSSRRYRAALPFALTGAASGGRSGRVDADLRRARPMQRLLLGDVGSGKTVVALHALLRAVEAGAQGALMAPTETLAQQHVDHRARPARAARRRASSSLTGDVPGAGEAAPGCSASPRATRRWSVGTHALLEQDVRSAGLAVAVVDEQHRFGVDQRAALADGAGAARRCT